MSNSVNASATVTRIREMTDCEQLDFHPVASRSFTGGYYLHPLLPSVQADFYFSDAAGDILVLFSGAVFNKVELNKFLNIKTTVPDPELIAELFRHDGPAFAERVNGDFAVFILEEKKKQAYLVRDHLGISPLSWIADRGSLFFSSDTVGLCRAFSERQITDSEFLLGYLKLIDHRRTPCKSVKKLLPGHYLLHSEAGTEIKKYWYPEKIAIDRNIKYGQMLSDLQNILWDSVSIRCDQRYWAGAHVSSGLDSGIVSVLSRREYPAQADFQGFSWTPASFVAADVKYDERKLVAFSCEKANIRPVFSDMTRSDFLRIVSSFYGNGGYFYEDKTVEQAVGGKTNLIFSGWGGDEFISSGGRGIDMDLLRSLKFRTFFRRNSKYRLRKIARNIVLYVLFPVLGILDHYTLKSFRDDARYLKKDFQRNDTDAVRNFYFHTSRHQLHLRLLQSYHLQERCECWFVNGYRKGVEYRYPLLDKRIIEYMLKIPSELLCTTGLFRPLLRELGMGILPEEIRLNESKTDPVFQAFNDELFRESAVLLMEEAGSWAGNPDLHFVNFRLLAEDIRLHKENSPQVDAGALCRALVYLKAMHEFTNDYRRSFT